MKFKYLLLLLVYVFASTGMYADDWAQGAIVLKTNKTLKGEISVKYDYDVVLYRLANEVMVFPAHKIKSFYLYDSREEGNRQFISLELAFGAATFHQFFELIVDGDVSVLRRQRIVWYSLHLEEIDYDYFVKNDEELTALNKFRRQVFPKLVKTSSGTLSSFVRENKLNPHKLSDVIRIIDHFNQLQATKNPLAKHQQS